ncbi:MAG: TonB-dependent receptor [Pseudomonadota bacterium]
MMVNAPFRASGPALFCLLIQALFPGHAQASGETRTLMELDEYVVTGTRDARRLLDSPVRTEILSRKTLDRLQARSLQDALRFVPGLLLRDIHGKSGQEVWMQGLDGNRVLVLIDGEPVPASTGSAVDLSQIGLADVERIEIVKGALSALYGSAAMGGVINVITRRGDKPLDYRLLADVGYYDEASDTPAQQRHAGGHLNMKQGALGLGLAFDVRDSDGFDLTPGTWSTQGDKGPKLNLDGRLRWQATPTLDFSFTPGYYSERLEKRFSTQAPGVGEIRQIKGEDAQRTQLRLDSNWRPGEGRALRAVLSQETFTDTTWQDALGTAEQDQSRRAEIGLTRGELSYSQPLGAHQQLSAGLVALNETLTQVQTRYESGAYKTIDEVGGKVSRDSVEAFVLDSLLLFDERLEILPGLRHQEDSGFGGKTTPKINVLYSPHMPEGYDLRLRAGVGQGYRVPNLKERHYIFDHSALGYIVRGNPDLRPEKSMSVQFGGEIVSHAHGLRLDLNLYHNDIDDLIATLDAGVEEGVRVFEYANIARARTQGLETVLEITPEGRLSYELGYTFLRAIDRDTGLDLIQRPRHQLKAGLHLDLPEVRSRLGLYAQWQSHEYADAANTQRSPAWLRTDLRLDTRLTRELTAYLGVDNIGNDHRDVADTADYRPLSPRLIYIGLRWDH